ncbi:MAG: hypothetical protein IH934_08135 [Nanoarchaeota archaeon]|nr:hypothetical protein [Nanoarchaeota archaeon]
MKSKSHKFLRNLTTRNSKSQAALEFLTTYAWAFLVIIIMISALAYFGVLSPSKLLPDRCNFGSEIGCDKNRMIINNVNDNTLTMRLANNFGTAVTVTAVTVTTDITPAGSCTGQINDLAIPATGFSWASDTTITLNADCSTGTKLVEKEKIKMSIEVDYYSTSAGEAYGKIIFGEIFTTIQ